ncbi:hypothetical protein UFOVP700_6 [uncultured Caudovirales phage]|uniref:Uncharacterized protein n=1 Tax=uncultured Caudovirales phage TaxID=2100421 RepID=A0A6J5NLS9_9CAUD|nr:hypothetical protein UFOVP700_6 [uncultured Caudovirales phage]
MWQLAIVLVLAASTAVAQTSAQPQQRWTPDAGRITAPNGQTLGYVDRNTGRITAPDGRTLGYQDSATGRITLPNGRPLQQQWR